MGRDPSDLFRAAVGVRLLDDRLAFLAADPGWIFVVGDNDVDLALLFIVVLIVECELDSCGSDSVRFIPEESPFWTNLFN